MDNTITYEEDELLHYGVEGQKKGIRRYQNKDGSYKPGAEGRYYNPERKSGKVTDKKGSLQALQKSGAKMESQKTGIAGSNGGGGGGAPDPDQENKNPQDITAPYEKTLKDGTKITVYPTSMKKEQTSGKSGSGGGSSSGTSSEKKKKKEDEEGTDDFKLTQLTDKIDNLFGEMDDEDWDEMELDDSEMDSIDNLITKYRKWREGNKSKTKQTKKIDSFIERYQGWRSNHDKAEHSDMYGYHLEHHGVKGMHWGIRRYQNPDGTLTEEGKRRKRKDEDFVKNVKNYVKSRLGIYDPDDDNPYVSQERRERRRDEKNAAKKFRETLDKKQLEIATKNADKLSEKARKASDRVDQLKKKQADRNDILGLLLNDKRYRNPDGSLTEEGKRRKSKGKEYVEDYWNAHDKKDPKYMSDKELQKRINRLNNENQYKNLSKSDTRKASEKLAKQIVNTVLITTLTSLAADQVKKHAPEIISNGKQIVERQIKKQAAKR